MAALISYGDRLIKELEKIQECLLELINISAIQVSKPNPAHSRLPPNPFTAIAPQYFSKAGVEQQRLQLQAKEMYGPWFESFRLLFPSPTSQIQNSIEHADKELQWWIELNGNPAPATKAEAEARLRGIILEFQELLRLKAGSGKNEVILVPDTNALIRQPDAQKYAPLAGMASFTFMLLPTVLQELDSLKNERRDETFRKKVEGVVRRIKGWHRQANLVPGKTAMQTVIYKVITITWEAREPDFTRTLQWLDSTNRDDRIIASTLLVQVRNPAAIVILVTADINLQNKAEVAYLSSMEPPR